jgi:hypothetical protein
MKFSEFSASEKNFIKFCRVIFGNMKTSLSLMIFHKGFEKYHSWKSVMNSLSTDLVLHAVGLRKIYSEFQEPWMTCLDELPLEDGTRETTIRWKQDKEKILDTLLPDFSSSIFHNFQHTILVHRIKGNLFTLETLFSNSISLLTLHSDGNAIILCLHPEATKQLLEKIFGQEFKI